MSLKKEFLSKNKLKFYEEVKKYQLKFKSTSEIEGYASSVIVGEKNYPEVKTYNISNENKKNSYFNTGDLVKKDYSEIIKVKARNILANTNFINIKFNNNKINESLINIYKSSKKIEFLSKFEKEISFDKILFSKISGIMGSHNNLTNIEENENGKTSLKVEKAISEDIKSQEAILMLNNSGVNEHQIINLFSLGTFGIASNQKKVPSRWAISAYDKIIENNLFLKIQNYKLIENFELYYYGDKGNYFLIILFPNYIIGEIIETWENIVEKDFFNYKNKLNKKEPETAGGYYATKLGIFENLNLIKRQASFISIRIIKDYEIPLGVVFVRECVRLAMKNKIFKSSNFEEVKEYIYINFKDFYFYFFSSKVLIENKQKRISDFF